ncbi:CHASE sensor domain-containing protein [Aeromonas rivipollensis]|uniref:CHASE sensor domain-containing protein n=1 Tax=Aeromonas rivipollensis TaxID=948519 RepID=UPI00399C948D
MTINHANPRLTLRQSLGRTHMMISLTAVCMAGLFLTITALPALRLYADHNLKLVARAISYTTEAAVVFDDKDAAKDALETITSREDIASASIRRLHGGPLPDHHGAAGPAPLCGSQPQAGGACHQLHHGGGRGVR